MRDIYENRSENDKCLNGEIQVFCDKIYATEETKHSYLI